MTEEELIAILAQAPDKVVESLQVSSYKLPKWSDLIKEYDPTQHKIMDESLFPPKLDESGVDDFKRTTLALQKLAVNRVAQSMFSTPVSRKYSFTEDGSEQEEKAAVLVEDIYRVQRSIDSENIERAKKLNASCQIATVWSVYEKESLFEKETSKFTLVHNTYSPMTGHTLYPITDPTGEVIVLSIAYTDTNDVEWMDVFTKTKTTAPVHIRYKKSDTWVEETKTPLEFAPFVYTKLNEPVWGDGTNKVEQLEEMESYQGGYIKRNALPTFTLDYGELGENDEEADTEEQSSDMKRVIKVGKGGKMDDVTWQGADAAITSRYLRLRNAFFEEIQVPDTSFANMVTSNTSAENKELIFADSKAKARDLGGEWERLFLEEINIVKSFLGVMYPSYKEVLKSMQIRSVIHPYKIQTKKENSEYISTAGNAMSLETKIGILDEVDDVAVEVKRIQEEASRMTNNL